MCTYDGAYTKEVISFDVCSCDKDINSFCKYHGKYKDVGDFRKSNEHEILKNKIEVESENQSFWFDW